MPDLYTLFAKIGSLPKRRIAEVDDFVDFLSRRGAPWAKLPAPARCPQKELSSLAD
jgi:hypothetical protein